MAGTAPTGAARGVRAAAALPSPCCGGVRSPAGHTDTAGPWGAGNEPVPGAAGLGKGHGVVASELTPVVWCQRGAGEKVPSLPRRGKGQRGDAAVQHGAVGAAVRDLDGAGLTTPGPASGEKPGRATAVLRDLPGAKSAFLPPRLHFRCPGTARGRGQSRSGAGSEVRGRINLFLEQSCWPRREGGGGDCLL